MPTIPNNQETIHDMDFVVPKLKQLCKYYLNCLALENANNVSVPKLIDKKILGMLKSVRLISMARTRRK